MKLPLQYFFWWASGGVRAFTIVGSGGGQSGGAADITTVQIIPEVDGWHAYQPYVRRGRRYEEIIAQPRVQSPRRVAATISEVRTLEAVGGGRGRGRGVISRVRQLEAVIANGGEASGYGIMSVSRDLISTGPGGYGSGIGVIDWLDTLAEDSEDEFILQEVA